MFGGAEQRFVTTTVQGQRFDTTGHRVLIDLDTVDDVDGWRSGARSWKNRMHCTQSGTLTDP
jgi:hypothetical protein